MLVMSQQLIEWAWSAPMRELAANIGLSDTGLKKLLAGFGIHSPPQGYWNKVRAGKAVLAKPKAGPRRPGETGRLALDSRFEAILEPVAPIPSSGPFASAAVPENLEQLRVYELGAIGRAASARKLDPVHPGLRKLLAAEERRREKVAKSDWHWDSPKFEGPVDRRRLRILNAIFLTLQKRGHSGGVDDRNEELHAHAIIGQTYVSLEISILGRHPKVQVRGYSRPDPALPATTPLILSVDKGYNRAPSQTWQDDPASRLEDRIAEIVAGLIVAGEGAFRRGLRENEERLERYRQEEEERRRKELEALNARRVEELLRSGELLRKASEIRALVAERRSALLADGQRDPEQMERWAAWALGEADKLDPIKSGQVRTHLVEPRLRD